MKLSNQWSTLRTNRCNMNCALFATLIGDAWCMSDISLSAQLESSTGRMYTTNYYLYVWIPTQANYSEHSFKCLNNSCQVKIKLETLDKSLSRHEITVISELYNNNMVIDSDDMFKCPKNGCDYYGFTDPGSCSANLQWAKCSYEWRELQHMTLWERTSKSLRDVMSLNPEILNYFNEVMFSSPCPKCEMKIYKIDGCNHMVWQKCKHEFCWFCHGDYPSYVHKGDSICGLRIATMVTLTLFAFLMVNFYSLYNDTYFARAQIMTLVFIGKFVISNLYGASVMINLGFSMAYSDKARNSNDSLKSTITINIFAFLVMFYPMVWGYFIYSFSFEGSRGGFIVSYLYYEIAIVLTLAVWAAAIAAMLWFLYFIVYKIGRYLGQKIISLSCKLIRRKEFQIKKVEIKSE